jgi:hypothetical protein
MVKEDSTYQKTLKGIAKFLAVVTQTALANDT